MACEMLFRQDHRISWSRPRPDLNIAFPTARNLSVTLPDLGLSTFSLREAIRSLGLPTIDGAKSPLEDLTGLLKFAATIEHGLMVQYLYAMYARKNHPGEKVAVQEVLRKIATEEMGHLLTVQNLLIASGEGPYLGRYDANADKSFDPFPFTLEPMSADLLAKYAACERPADKEMDPAVLAQLPDILTAARRAAGMIPVRVGLLYAKIYWILRESDRPMADPAGEPWVGFPIAEAAAECPADWHVKPFPIRDPSGLEGQVIPWQANRPTVIIGLPIDRIAALTAIADVTAQGEGFGASPEAHFYEFVEAFNAVKADNDPTRLVPTNPWYRDSPGVPGHAADEITSEAGRLVASIADQLYELVLLSIALFFSLPDSTQATVRATLSSVAMTLMKRCVGPLAGILVQIDRNSGISDGRMSAPCFSLPAANPLSVSEIKVRILQLLQDSVRGADEIANSSNVAADVKTKVSDKFVEFKMQKTKLEQALSGAS